MTGGGDGGGQRVRLLLPDGMRDALAPGLEAAYPGEGCGVLLGRTEGHARQVTEVRPADNRRTDRRDRYRVDPDLLRQLMEEESRDGPRVLGFYHSHPDAPPEPSETDREAAWPWYLYLVVPVRAGRARLREARAWELVDGRFRERAVAYPESAERNR